MSKYQYEDAVKQLQETGMISLLDLKSLSHDDLVVLFEEIKVWCLYANGKIDKLAKESKKKKKRMIKMRLGAP
jgi:GTP-binding protein EngB required for normal cell division